MSREYERMKSLLRRAGLSVNDNGISDAEVYAYARGLETVCEKLSEAEEIISTDAGLSRYASYLGIDAAKYGGNELKELIIRRASYKLAELTGGDFDAEFALTGAASLEIGENGITVKGINPARMYELSVFLNGFVPAGVKLSSDGGGMDFDAWDATGYTFNQYDALALPFDILDTLRSDMFEQY